MVVYDGEKQQYAAKRMDAVVGFRSGQHKHEGALSDQRQERESAVRDADGQERG